MRYAVALATVLSLAACSSKTPPAKETGSAAPAMEEKIAVPGANTEGAAPNFAPGSGAAASGGAIASGASLRPEEGKLAVEPPPEAKAGSEVTAKVVITPTTAYKVNTEFPTKLELQAPAGITIAKAQLTAGGPDKAKGDAEAFGERELAFAVKLTPAQAGTFTINGTLKFAVCDKDTCLPKKEPISIAIAAK